MDDVGVRARESGLERSESGAEPTDFLADEIEIVEVLACTPRRNGLNFMAAMSSREATGTRGPRRPARRRHAGVGEAHQVDRDAGKLEPEGVGLGSDVRDDEPVRLELL
jgi:hypothetical protein